MRKKKWGLVAFLSAAMVCCNGCVSDSSQTDMTSEVADTEETLMEMLAEEVEEQTPKLNKIYAEQTHHQNLAYFLTEFYGIPEEYQTESRYYYNYVDLNQDGKSEILAMVVGEYTSESGGETILLLEENENIFQVMQVFSMVRTPVIVSDESTDGWRDLIFFMYGGGVEPGYRICQYHENTGYNMETTIFLEELDESVCGTQVLSNNLIDDMDKGNFLPLVQ